LKRKSLHGYILCLSGCSDRVFFTYSKLVEKVFHIGDRETPAVTHPDEVDYVPMKT